MSLCEAAVRDVNRDRSAPVVAVFGDAGTEQIMAFHMDLRLANCPWKCLSYIVHRT